MTPRPGKRSLSPLSLRVLSGGLPRRVYLVGVFSLTAGLGCEARQPAEFRIGLLAASGDRYWEASGAPSIRGARLAEEEIDEAGGVMIRGRPYRLRVVVREYESRPDAASSAARGLLNQDSVHALVGPQLSAHAIPVSVIAEDARVPMISPMSTSPETTAGKRFVFRLASLDHAQAEAVARFARDSLHLTRAAVLFDQADTYSRDLASHFQVAFEEAGGDIVSVEDYTTDAADDFSEQLSRIAEADPDALYLPNRALEDTIQLRQAREAGIEAQILGSDSWDLLAYAHLPQAQGVIVTHQWHYDIPTPETDAFLDHFQAENGRLPRTTAAMTYDAVKILALAASRAGSLDPDSVRAALAAMGGYRGVTGLISFGGRQDPDRSLTLSTIRNGEVVVLMRIDP